MEMWNKAWEFLINEHVFYMFIACSVFALLLARFKPLARFKRIIVGKNGIELDASGNAIDPKIPCPYTHSYNAAMESIKAMDKKFEKMSGEMEMALEADKSISINLNKLLFYSKELPEEERMIAGLTYVAIGSNGKMKADVKRFARECPITYRAMCKIKPELRFKDSSV